MGYISLDTVGMSEEVKSVFQRYVNSRVYGNHHSYIKVENSEDPIYFIIGLLELYYHEDLGDIQKTVKFIEEVVRKDPPSKDELHRFRVAFNEHVYLSVMYEDAGYSKLASYGSALVRLAISTGKGLLNRANSDQHIIKLLESEIDLESEIVNRGATRKNSPTNH